MSTPSTHLAFQQPLRDRRAQVRRRLLEVTTLIDTLAAERILLEAELDSLVYPVLDLPPEITSRIFESLPVDAQPSSSSAPLLFTHICRQWRAIALATPRLWKSVTFDFRTYEHNNPERLQEKWLQNSANQPLSLSFDCRLDQQTQRLIDMSLAHCHR
ncbi:hypothetical protein B0H13DRAFT_1639566 [Mycena leptocephala]|nr:hypothetical protein B0H13DRAFT_1639566 [Mycena leptocephala]